MLIIRPVQRSYNMVVSRSRARDNVERFCAKRSLLSQSQSSCRKKPGLKPAAGPAPFWFSPIAIVPLNRNTDAYAPHTENAVPIVCITVIFACRLSLIWPEI